MQGRSESDLIVDVGVTAHTSSDGSPKVDIYPHFMTLAVAEDLKAKEGFNSDQF